jgi:hypothetical protein
VCIFRHNQFCNLFRTLTLQWVHRYIYGKVKSSLNMTCMQMYILILLLCYHIKLLSSNEKQIHLWKIENTQYSMYVNIHFCICFLLSHTHTEVLLSFRTYHSVHFDFAVIAGQINSKTL